MEGMVPAPRVPGKAYDLLGRQVPRRMSALQAAQGIRGLAAQFKKTVPDEYLELEVTEDGERLRVVRCVCGTRTIVEGGVMPMPECNGRCGRFFCWTGRSVRVAGPYDGGPWETGPGRDA